MDPVQVSRAPKSCTVRPISHLHTLLFSVLAGETSSYTYNYTPE